MNTVSTAGIYYDLRAMPITFDAAVFFGIAAGLMKQHGIAQFDVHIVAGAFRNTTPREKVMTDEERQWRLSNIILKLPRLIPEVGNIGFWQANKVLLEPTRFPNNYDPSKIMPGPYSFAEAIYVTNKGADIQVFSASGYARAWAKQALGDSRTLVMAIRQSEFNQYRDAKMDDWHKLYKHLVAKGFRVVVIPDQRDALMTKNYRQYDWEALPEAAIDMDLRLALYQEAHANICWTGGHTALLWLSKSKFLVFGNLNSGGTVSSAAWFERSGMKIGEQPIIFRPHQEYDWKEASEVDLDYLVNRTEQYLATLDMF